MDQPFGTDVAYTTAGYPLNGAQASVDTTGITAIANYSLNDSFSVHGGLRAISASGLYDVPALPPSPAYASTYSGGSGTGLVIGGAFEKEEIALRIALTYSQGIAMDLDGTVGDLSTTLPESLNLDFQTGIAADTLLFGSIRHVGWNGFSLDDSLAGSILSYDADVTTYNLGVGRRLNDKFSVSLSLGHEASTGDPVGNLGPTDGYTSYQVGAAYTMDSGMKVSGGVRYVEVGDATTSLIGSTFSGNSVVGLGLKLSMNF